MSKLHSALMLSLFVVSGTFPSHGLIPRGPGDITSKAVWDAPQEAWSKMQDECGSEGEARIECILSIMRQAGASPEAMGFTRLLEGEGFMESFREMGRVDLAGVFNPFLANSNNRFVLVNGTPQLIDVGYRVGENIETEIRNDRMYPSLRRRFPELTLGGYPQYETTRRLPTGGQRFLFKFQLVNGCRACWAEGYAHVAYDFDGAGNFLGTKLVRLSKDQPVGRQTRRKRS